ncbi:hypothetical protein PTSG_09742 [Salpingoeca rosetta]|uniref:PPM-type phosphatase domain-containing protein n=1 Tax=Salpingoeca rosetta (strain ATCC 50818 / BSB-021) TaxID=946362 RepID=F2UNX4_SALR5|nr:uncharacterized protein PTSG_09742 [Salpingoeca rosetta]EGD79329.1 hypothetical protein PTSG_09742 [Salpingoeca rosetta]|eukprot:XP_004989098.1 hypothetical protein PTSG_09742 [Salpingoeca rosetta]
MSEAKDAAKARSATATRAMAEESEQPTKKSKQGFFTVSAAACRKGVRDEMQDTHVMLDDFSTVLKQPYPTQVRFYAVYDGHAGKNASEYCAEHLHQHLATKLPTDTSEKGFGGRMKRCLIDTYTTTDKEFLTTAAAQSPAWKDGCTAATAVILDQVIYAANVGDTRMVVGRLDDANDTIKGVTLSKVHIATLYDERQRIQKAGGKVVDGRIQGIMEVSRTIGDGRFKTLGVTAQPHVSKCTLTQKVLTRDGGGGGGVVASVVATNPLLSSFPSLSPLRFLRPVPSSTLNVAVLRVARTTVIRSSPRGVPSCHGQDVFLLLACDGLWDHLSIADAVAFVWDKIKQEKEAGSSLDVNCAQRVANQLVNEAVHRGSDDNVSALLVLFHNIAAA